MKACYCDESGTGEEPIAVMAGVVVDSHRMHVTKEHWSSLLNVLSRIVNNDIKELHTRHFYAGSGIWKGIDGQKRARVIDYIFNWLIERKHHIVYTALDNEKYRINYDRKIIPPELSSPWRFMGFHLILSMQKAFQRIGNNKGNTIFVFDNNEKEKLYFTDLINKPPNWSDSYYGRNSKFAPLNQIVDVPYFGDSKDVALIQVADFISYFLRRYAEIKEELIPPRYSDEEGKICSWAECISSRSIGRSNIYPIKARCDCAEMFYANAPASIRDL